MSPVDRRSVLKGLLGATLAVPGLAARALGGPRPSVVVVGSGIAGLSAAYELQKAGFGVVVFESRHLAGGRMAEDWRGPFWRPTGAWAVHEANREMYALAAEVDLVDQFRGGREYPMYPLDNGHAEYLGHLRWHTTEVMNVPGLSEQAKGRLSAILPDLAEIRATVDPCLLHTGAAWDKESVWEYFARKLGEDSAREVVDYWVQPGLDPWRWNAEETSMIAWLAVVAQQDARWVIPRDGIGVLTRKLATLLDVRLNTPAMRIAPVDESGRRAVHYLTPEGRQEAIAADVVVCATEGNLVLPLVQGLSPRERAFFESIHMVKWAALTYVLKREHAPTRPMGGGVYTRNVSDPLKRAVGSWQAVPGDPDDPANPPLVTVALPESERARWIESGQDMASYCLPLVTEFYPDLSADKIEDVVISSRDDMVVYIPVGFVRELAAFSRAQESSRRRLYFAGEYLGHAHIGGACASGRTVARTILRHWS
jgi:oxygen-dependent protoporphyrinogen oxidase